MSPKARLSLDRFHSLTTLNIRLSFRTLQQGKAALTCTFTLERSYVREGIQMSTG